MSYNLTPEQKLAVRHLVEKTRSGELPEGEVRYASDKDGISAIPSTGEHETLDLPDYFSKGTFRALDDEGLVYFNDEGSKGFTASVRQKAYEAVDSGFE